MLNSAKVISFVATKDAARARVFYEEVLGLRFVSEGQFALQFDANGTMLRIQKVEQLTPAQHTVLGWEVADIHATVKGLAGMGVAFERYGFLPQDDSGV